MSTSNLSRAFCSGRSSCNLVRVNSTLNVLPYCLVFVKILWLPQFESALRLNVCLFVGCGKKDIVSKYSYMPVCGNMINEYN